MSMHQQAHSWGLTVVRGQARFSQEGVPNRGQAGSQAGRKGVWVSWGRWGCETQGPMAVGSGVLGMLLVQEAAAAGPPDSGRQASARSVLMQAGGAEPAEGRHSARRHAHRRTQRAARLSAAGLPHPHLHSAGRPAPGQPPPDGGPAHCPSQAWC